MKNKQVLNDLNLLLKIRFNDYIKDIILFGSQLKGNVKSDSDFDILIVVKKKPDWKIERELSDLCFEIDLKYGIITDTHILAEEEINSPRGKQPIFINALTNGLYA